MLKEYCALAQRADRTEVVAYKEHRTALVDADVAHFANAFLLEFLVAYSEHFVGNEDFGIEEGSNSKGEADEHAARISFYWCIDELS